MWMSSFYVLSAQTLSSIAIIVGNTVDLNCIYYIDLINFKLHLIYVGNYLCSSLYIWRHNAAHNDFSESRQRTILIRTVTNIFQEAEKIPALQEISRENVIL